MAEPVYHHNALGIHPGAYYQSTPPTPHNDGDLWVDTSAGPPYQLKVWNVATAAWQLVGIVGILVRTTDPSGGGLPDGTLWVDTSAGPPYQLKVWDVATTTWQLVGIASASSSGVDDTGTVATDCLTFPNGAVLCNPSSDLVTLVTPSGTHQWDATGYTLPGDHRLVRADG